MQQRFFAYFSSCCLLLLAACSDAAPPGTGSDSGVTDATGGICGLDEPCPSGQECQGGVCVAVTPDAGTDAGQVGARIEVCTPAGCGEPHQLDFGGSRAGVQTQQTLVVRSIGERPLELRNVALLNTTSEFSVDPEGDVNITLEPGEETAIRVSHIARDGLADRENLQLISNAERSRVLVELTTEYKGVPTLHAAEAPTAPMQTMLVDFGNIRIGSSDVRRVYMKNTDSVLDGSILTVQQVNLDPATSSNFALNVLDTLPANLNQFNDLCISDANCTSDPTDTCETTLGVCQQADGTLRDILSVEVSFVGTTPGMIEERIQVLSNDGGASGGVRTILLRANATFQQLDVAPDPINFAAGFIGWPSTQEVTLTNNGTAEVTINSIDLAATSTFALDLAGLSVQPPFTIAPAQAETFAVVFNPAVEGSFTSQLTIDSNDPMTPIQTISVAGNAFVAPELDLSASNIDFGDTHVAAGASQVITVRNVGGSDLLVPSIVTTSSVPFSVDLTGFNSTIAPNTESSFTIRYSPGTPSFPNVELGQVQVTTNDPRVQPFAAVDLAGRGVNPAAALFPGNQVNFNTVTDNPIRPLIYANQIVSTQVSLFNSGTGPLQVLGLTYQNDVRGVFSIANAPLVPLEVPAGQSLVLDLVYTSPTAGTDGADLEIQTNDFNLAGGIVTVSVIGDTTACAAVPGTIGGFDINSNSCVYSCDTDRWDLDGDLNTMGSNGCEYTCTQISTTDLPDGMFVDANCDGIDGEIANAVFVSPGGNNNNSGFTPDEPKPTIGAGIAVAQSSGRYVLVAAGSYNITSTLNLVNGVSVYGGYNATDWSRGVANVSQVTHNGAVVNGRVVGVSGAALTALTNIDRLTIVTPNTSSPGASNYGLYCASCSGLRLSNSTVIAGSGGNGAAGPTGTVGAAGNNGVSGGAGSCDGGGWGAGGTGGTSSCGRNGGSGGRGGTEGSNSGISGSSGAGGTSGGFAGGGGDPGGDGGNGSIGTAGGSGNNGGGGANGFVTGGFWVSFSGGAGSGGNNGNGGGGGGGGGGQGGFWVDDGSGNGGGGGGAGGCGGGGGGGGNGGGGSFAVFLASSNGAVLSQNTIQSGNGGNGGTGGSGGTGGARGAGALGGTACSSEIGEGGDGGRGGNGGRGGHGGGGSGGPSYGVYRYLSSITNTGNSIMSGNGGAGGSSQGNNGAAGASGAIN